MGMMFVHHPSRISVKMLALSNISSATTLSSLGSRKPLDMVYFRCGVVRHTRLW